jgi:hypothetical protein
MFPESRAGGKVRSPTHRPRSTPQKHYFSAFGTPLCQSLSKSQRPVRPEGLGQLKKIIHLIGSRNCDFSARSIVPQPLSYRVPRFEINALS